MSIYTAWNYFKVYVVLVSIAACVAIVAFAQVQGHRRKNRAYSYFSFTQIFFLATTILDFVYLSIVPDDFGTALQVKIVDDILVVLGYYALIIYFLWLQYERLDPRLLIPYTFLAGIVIAIIFFPDMHPFIVFMENGEIIGMGIGKQGILSTVNNVFVFVNSILIIWYFTRLYIKAPRNAKGPMRMLATWIWILGIASSVIYAWAYAIPRNLVAVVLFSLQVSLGIMQNVIFIIFMVKHPANLFYLHFRVDRLMVLSNESGICLFERRFTDYDVNDELLGGLFQAIQQMAIAVLEKGKMHSIQMENGVLTFKKGAWCTTVLISARQSFSLHGCIEQFLDAFEAKYKPVLEHFSGNTNLFDGAMELVDKYFLQVPLHARQPAGEKNCDVPRP